MLLLMSGFCLFIQCFITSKKRFNDWLASLVQAHIPIRHGNSPLSWRGRRWCVLRKTWKGRGLNRFKEVSDSDPGDGIYRGDKAYCGSQMKPLVTIYAVDQFALSLIIFRETWCPSGRAESYTKPARERQGGVSLGPDNLPTQPHT